MKLNSIKLLLLLLPVLLAGRANAQLTQFCIGSPRNEIATKVLHMSDGSTVVAGYQYDIVSGAVQNAQMILLKISSTGAIAWQRKMGIANTNNLIQDMIITHDNNIVVVGTAGRSFIYGGNEAFIGKYNGATGTPVFEKAIHDATTTTGGEIFFGVTELGAAANYELVAVGCHDFTTNAGAGMVCVFTSAGAFMYDENYFYASDGNEFQSVTTSADGKSVYFCGQYNGDFGDGIVVSYTPGTTSGVENWKKNYDFYQNGNLQDNFFTKIVLSGSNLLIEGGSGHDFTTTASGQFILTVSAADGSHPSLRAIKNSNKLFSNSPAFAMMTGDHVFTVQSPADASYDPVIWTTSATTSAVVTEITSLSAKTHNPPVRFDFTDAIGLHSILDMQYYGPNLYLAGSTNASAFGNNDMYVIITAPSFASQNKTCDTIQDTVSITDTVVTNPADPTITHTTFAIDTDLVTDSALSFKIQLMCGDDPSEIPCFNTKQTTLNVKNDGKCDFTATVTVSTGGIVVGYQWTIPGEPPVVVHTSATSNTQTFSLPDGVSGDVCVTVYVENPKFTLGQNPCCDTTMCFNVSCTSDGTSKRMASGTEGMDNIKELNGLSVYPNPTGDVLNIASSSTHITNIKVVDITGRTVAEYDYENVDQATISLSTLQPGNYLIRVNNNLSRMISKIK